MKVEKLENVFDSYLKMYKITCTNNDGDIRNYEMVSRTGNLTPQTMGEKVHAVMVIPFVGDKILLSREFRIPLNRWVYNFPAGLVDPGETIEDAAVRELREETGLKATEIIGSLPPSYTSSGMTDEKLAVVFVKAEGEIIGSDNVNEEVESRLYTLEELKKITAFGSAICSRTQLVSLLLIMCGNDLNKLGTFIKA